MFLALFNGKPCHGKGHVQLFMTRDEQKLDIPVDIPYFDPVEKCSRESSCSAEQRRHLDFCNRVGVAELPASKHILPASLFSAALAYLGGTARSQSLGNIPSLCRLPALC